MAEPYTPGPPNGGTDDYRCFLVDPGLTGRVSLTGARFEPQNTAIVHHAIFFRLAPEQAGRARELDESTPARAGPASATRASATPAGWRTGRPAPGRRSSTRSTATTCRRAAA
ncbi:hypothetical protein ACFQ0B_13560 [Nonomuraea thailandensis]